MSDNRLRGSAHPQSKLTENDVIRICELYATGQYTQAALSQMFNICNTQILRIVNGYDWKSVTGGKAVTRKERLRKEIWYENNVG